MFFNPSCLSNQSTIKGLWAGLSDEGNPEKEWGRAYGYPECCISEYLKPEGEVVFEKQLRELLNSDSEYPEAFNYLMPSQTPCSINCQASLELLEIWKGVLEAYDPEAADFLKHFNILSLEHPAQEAESPGMLQTMVAKFLKTLRLG